MNETFSYAPRYTGRIRATFADAGNENAATPLMVEVVGGSDVTVAEAVRYALARASQSLRTLDGAGVLVIPQVPHEGTAPRYRVTVKVTAASPENQPIANAPSMARRLTDS